MKKYGIYESDGTPVILVIRNKAGKKIREEQCRAGTKNAARRKAELYGGTWRKD